ELQVVLRLCHGPHSLWASGFTPSASRPSGFGLLALAGRRSGMAMLAGRPFSNFLAASSRATCCCGSASTNEPEAAMLKLATSATVNEPPCFARFLVSLAALGVHDFGSFPSSSVADS